MKDESGLTWDYSDSYAWMEHAERGFGPVMITCALNGGVQGKEANPAIPETPAEIAASALEAYNAGASIVHIHPRNPGNWADGAETTEQCLEVVAAVRERCPDLIINITTGGGPTTAHEVRYRWLAASPELASLNLGPDMSRLTIAERPAPLEHPHPVQPFDVCIPFTYGQIEDLAQRMLDGDIKPEIEMYHPGQYWVLRELRRKNLLKTPYMVQFVMAYQTAIFPTPQNVARMISELPPDSVYFVAGIGHYQLPMTTLSILSGGHVRVGLEDNIYYRRGQKLKGNGEAVERAARIARELNREVASPMQARAMLGISIEPRQFAAPKRALA